MSSLSSLQPSALWQFFSKICSIPHPSKHEQALIDWILTWAEQQGLKTQQDKVGNVFIYKPATPGMEASPSVALQAHIDMVPQANSDSSHDFTRDPIRPYIDGEWLTADGTTLGADNGIGLASILAVLASDDIKHGPIEALLTIDEEAGMTGAFGLEPGYLKSSLLINTDSEQEGEVYMGCAGGGDTLVSFPCQWQAPEENSAFFRISISGLKGGHSGCDVNAGRANANKLLFSLLAQAQQQGISAGIADVKGGSLRNAIPREASVLFAIDASQKNDLQQLFREFSLSVNEQYASIETTLQLGLTPAESASQIIQIQDSENIIAALNACPNGVVSMSQAIEGVVESSLNLGVISLKDQQVTAQILVRSLLDAGRHQIESSLASLFSLSQAKVTHSGGYPGWQPDPQSQLKNTVEQAHHDLFGVKPKTMVIHAGLECGLFKSAYPEMDMVSLGPTIKFPHSPDEKVHIASVERYWQLLVSVLAAL